MGGVSSLKSWKQAGMRHINPWCHWFCTATGVCPWSAEPLSDPETNGTYFISTDAIFLVSWCPTNNKAQHFRGAVGWWGSRALGQPQHLVHCRDFICSALSIQPRATQYAQLRDPAFIPFCGQIIVPESHVFMTAPLANPPLQPELTPFLPKGENSSVADAVAAIQAGPVDGARKFAENSAIPTTYETVREARASPDCTMLHASSE